MESILYIGAVSISLVSHTKEFRLLYWEREHNSGDFKARMTWLNFNFKIKERICGAILEAKI